MQAVMKLSNDMFAIDFFRNMRKVLKLFGRQEN